MDVRDHAFLITGAASGLGAAVARRFVSRGGRVALADLQVGSGEALAAELGEQAAFVGADVTDSSQVQAAIDLSLVRFGRLDGVICCAGVLGPGRVIGKDGPFDLARFARVVEVNLTGTFNVIRLASMAMSMNHANRDGERGVIVCTSSVAAFDGQIGQAAYSASKAGIAGMMLPIARELARHGIRIAAIAPGVFETPMMDSLSDEARQALIDQVPFPHRLGKPDEFASLVEHIIENAMLNGETIRLDGALRMPPR